MIYKLNSDWEMCGWNNLPFALRNKVNKNVIFFNKSNYEVIYNCNIGLDIDNCNLSFKQKSFLKEMLDLKIIIKKMHPSRTPTSTYVKYPSRFKYSAQWSITGKCNYRCKHCFQSAPFGHLYQCSFDECRHVIKELSKCGIQIVSLTGGEPLIRKDFWNVIDEISDHNILIDVIYTNASKINKIFIEKLKERGLKPRFQISFDGIGVHDWLRGVPGAQKHALNAIKLLIDNGFNVSVSIVLIRRNAEVMRETIDKLADIGVDSVRIGHAVPQGEWLKYPEEFLGMDEELNFYKTFLPDYINNGRRVDLQCEGLFIGYSDSTLASIKSRRNPFRQVYDTSVSSSYNESEDILSAKKGFALLTQKSINDSDLCTLDSCPTFRRTFFISSSGQILPCMGLDECQIVDVFPNIFEMSLKDILNNSVYTKYADLSINDVLKHNKECLECELKTKCCSGCRASALSNNCTDYFAKDKRMCSIVREKWDLQIANAIDAFDK